MARAWYKKGPLRIGVERGGPQPLKVEFDEYAWPKKKTHLLVLDEDGLPVFCWRDPDSWLPRAIFVLGGRDTDPRRALFVHVNGNYEGRGGQLQWLFGVPLAILALLIFIPIWNSYFYVTYTDVRNAPFDLDTAPVIMNGVYDVIIGYGLWPVGAGVAMALGYCLGLVLTVKTTKRLVWNGVRVEITLRDWGQLKSFDTTDTNTVYGSLQAVEPLTSSKAPRFIIRAHFGIEKDLPVEVSRSTYNMVSVESLHQIMTREFILKRQAYLDQLPSAPARSMSNRRNGHQGGNWSNDIPDRL